MPNAETTQVPFNLTVFMVSHACEYVGSAVTSKGVFRKGDPLHQPLPFLLLLRGVAILLSAIMRRLLRPLKQPRFVADMLTGSILGPTLFRLSGWGEFYASLFTLKLTAIMGFLEVFSMTTIAFVVGIRTDVHVIKTSGKLSWIIGIICFVLPVTFARYAC